MTEIAAADYGMYSLLAGILFVALAALFLRQLSTVFDLFSLNLIYIAFGSSGLIAFYTGTGRETILDELLLLCVWLIVTKLGMSIRPVNSPKHTAPVQISTRTNRDIAAAVVVTAVSLAYIFPILSSGLLSGADGSIDNRFLIADESKIQAYLFGAVGMLPPAIIFRMFGRISLGKVFLMLVPFWLVQIATLSKTGALFPIFAISIYFSLLFNYRLRKPPSLVKQVSILAGMGLFVYVAFAIITSTLTRLEISPLNFLLARLYSSFDGLYLLAQINWDPQGSLSLIQWYFSPFLKVANAFTNEYNASNFVVAVQYFGYSPSYSGNLPNNNHIGELLLTQSGVMRPLMASFTGLTYGFFYIQSVWYLRTGGRLLLPAAFMACTPLGFLIDGQGWFSAFLVSIMLCIPTELLARVISAVRARPATKPRRIAGRRTEPIANH